MIFATVPGIIIRRHQSVDVSIGLDDVSSWDRRVGSRFVRNVSNELDGRSPPAII